MSEICMYGRFGQPVAKLASAVGQYALKQGKHVQIANAFGAFRIGGPMNVVVKIEETPVRERSTIGAKPDIVVVLDNSLFTVIDMTKGLKAGGTVMALGVDSSVLGEKANGVNFVPLDSFIKGNSLGDAETGLISSLKSQQVF